MRLARAKGRELTDAARRRSETDVVDEEDELEIEETAVWSDATDVYACAILCGNVQGPVALNLAEQQQRRT